MKLPDKYDKQDEKLESTNARIATHDDQIEKKITDLSSEFSTY